MSLYLGNDRVNLRSLSAIPYTIVGNPTITSDGIASGFTDKTDYLTLGAFNPGTNKWKFTTKVKFNSLTANMSLIDRNSSTRCFQIAMRTTGKWRVNISTNGSTKANEVDGTHVCTINTIYYLSFEYDGSKYYLKFSTDNINWTTDITINNSTKIYPVSSMSMGHSWYNSGTEKWDGEIYLRSTHLDVQGQYTDTWKLHALEGDYLIVDDKLVWANPNIYLQGSGTQYIDMGITPNNTTKIKCRVLITESNKFFYGSRTSSSSSNQHEWIFAMSGGSGICYPAFGSTRSVLSYDWNTTTIYTIENGQNGAYINGTKIRSYNTYTFNSTLNMYLFALNQNNSVESRMFVGNIYSFQVEDNSNLVRHFVPVPADLQIGSFTVPSNGMFDIVNQQFYPNLGTGTFTYGKDV